MNDLLQSGQHPDADQLSAFAEHALPPHEQQQTLAHLAACADCRAVVFLAQQAAPVELTQSQPVAARRSWFATWAFAWPAAAALACLVLLTIHILHKPAAPTTTASIEHITPPPVVPAEPLAVPASPAPAPVKAVTPSEQERSRDKGSSEMATDSVSTVPIAAPSMRMLGGMSAGSPVTAAGAIEGVITDPTGASVPHAKITAVSSVTGVQITRESSGSGSFSLAPLPPGNYTVEASAPGFERVMRSNVQVDPLQQVAMNMKLDIGSASETVTVTSAPPMLDARNSTLAGTIENETYSNLPIASRNLQQPKSAAAPSAIHGAYGGPSQINQSAGGMGGSAGRAATAAPVQSQVAAAPGPPPAPAAPAITGASLNQNYVPDSNAPASDDATAEVTDALITQSPKKIAPPRPNLPSHLPVRSNLAHARVALAIDTAGALFRSDDVGVTWHPITAQWQGHALTLRLAPPVSTGIGALAKNSAAAAKAKTPAAPIFELTTDAGVTYTSIDGQTWQHK
jgi:Carboxypeptidase regulatory-like domain/Putative zinc-finger